MYNASKAALHETIRCIARERASDRFSINVLAPGLVEDTEMTKYVYQRSVEIRGRFDTEDDLDRYMLEGIPMDRAAEPEEIAEVVWWLLTAPHIQYLNGAIIPMNGGRS
jgi:NAD(P)-dependent dehydrogenase (short-subunit alcohol dehydrogenase family)